MLNKIRIGLSSSLYLSMTEQLSGVVQVPTGALYSCPGRAEIDLLSLRPSVCQSASLGDFLLAPRAP